MNKARTIIIGDVHGCFDELQRLLKKVGATSRDRIISVGDLLGKGPDSAGVLDWAMGAKNLRCVLGNHEKRVLDAWKRGEAPKGKPYDEDTMRQLGHGMDRYMRFIDSWPLMIRGRDHLIVHGGFDPRRPTKEQEAEYLVNVRTLADTGKPWYEHYTDEKLVVFGHWARKKVVRRRNAIGLDTGCVYGGRLTALVLPERKLVSVKAKKIYRAKPEWN